MELGFVKEYRDFRYRNYERVARWMERHETSTRFGAAFVLALLTGALAQIQIYTPLTPVPFTMQVFGVVLMGGLLGSRWGAVSALLYAGLGLLGLPVYAGQWEMYDGFRAFSGVAVFTTKLSAWYILGFVAQAYIVGTVVDGRSERRRKAWIVVAPLALAGLLVFALLDAYYLSDYGALYKTSAFPNAWFLLLSLGLLAIIASVAWLAWTRKARQERIELFSANVVGLLVLYVVGALGFFGVWTLLGLGPLSLDTLLAFAVLPFIPVDLVKILLAVGLLTLVRPTKTELDARRTPEAPASNV